MYCYWKKLVGSGLLTSNHTHSVCLKNHPTALLHYTTTGLGVFCYFCPCQYCTCLGSLVPMKKECPTRPSGRPPLLHTPEPRSDGCPQESQITVRLRRLYSLSAPLVLWAPCRGRHATSWVTYTAAPPGVTQPRAAVFLMQDPLRNLPCHHRHPPGKGCVSPSSWPFPVVGGGVQ